MTKYLEKIGKTGGIKDISDPLNGRVKYGKTEMFITNPFEQPAENH